MMTAKGIAKLVEEVGELQAELGQLQQVLGKKLACFHTDAHFDGSDLRDRLEQEMGDVKASIAFVSGKLGLNQNHISARAVKKLSLFEQWDAEQWADDPGVDAPQHA